ncbi:MAG: DUF362 domain-containing protein [Bacteroides sp.]|nr:DUF362 domain-containing protein [Roseburia sp.]MCM1347372.1 DUF362 domain-containing protein [Bacteroides sp.]MCM1421847.1 DUF362 domain-containing protein [Bacteroides sp.]
MKFLSSITTTIVSLFVMAAPHTHAQQFVPNSPMGEAKGIYPGRVTFIHNKDAARWDGTTGHWWDEGNIDTEILDGMYDKSLCGLTGSKSPKDAWKNIFTYYNKNNSRGKRGYKAGETIVIKVNLNNTFDTNDRDNEIDQSPQATCAILRQLIEFAKVPEECIVVYDATLSWKARAIPDRIYAPAHSRYPKVRWMSANGSEGVEAADWVEDAITYTDPTVALGSKLPKAVVEADYLINLSLLKGHEITGVTAGAKNHFGSIQFPARMHDTPTVNQRNGKYGDYSALVDLMGCPNLGKKTVLHIVDGLYGMQTNVGAPNPQRDKWKTFGNQWSSCYLMSLDPVAIECVCLDFLYAEFGDKLGFSGARQFPEGSSKHCDNYLMEAARGTNDKFGEYRPNGTATGSLGVFEHWNNPQERKYSRNMGKKEGIELFTIGF